ncbi:MAG: hypothetical protein ACRDRW_01235 [Pseudonocardiaceae bacterium]
MQAGVLPLRVLHPLRADAAGVRPGGFYRRHGFEVLGERAGLDMWVVFGVHTLVYPDPGGRMFVRYRPR